MNHGFKFIEYYIYPAFLSSGKMGKAKISLTSRRRASLLVKAPSRKVLEIGHREACC
jgi:hypothetical protein